MKTTLLFIITLLCASVTAQTDKHGNPVFNSVITAEETKGDLTLVSNYYTLRNNIENKGSSVYVDEHPTPDDVISSAKQLPSEFYLVAKNQKAVAMLMVQLYPKKEIMLMYPATMESKTFPLAANGDIAQSRAEEIISQKYDAAAFIKDGVLTFNKKTYTIIPTEKTKEQVLQLIESQNLHSAKPSQMQVMTQSEIKAFITQETAAGGKLDFFTPIKDIEYNSVQIKPGVFSTNIGIALYKWGRANFDLGINTVEDAYALFATIKGRALNPSETEYIKLGFNKELEKE